MGFYLRKSFRAGPVRLNLSKSGLGLSAGVKGMRLGSGPRGDYIHAGRKGLYYRQSLKKGKSKRGRAKKTEKRDIMGKPDEARKRGAQIGGRRVF